MSAEVGKLESCFLGDVRAWMLLVENIPAGKRVEAEQLQLPISCSLGKLCLKIKNQEAIEHFIYFVG